jgi:hypothetical protein
VLRNALVAEDVARHLQNCRKKQVLQANWAGVHVSVGVDVDLRGFWDGQLGDGLLGGRAVLPPLDELQEESTKLESSKHQRAENRRNLQVPTENVAPAEGLFVHRGMSQGNASQHQLNRMCLRVSRQVRDVLDDLQEFEGSFDGSVAVEAEQFILVVHRHFILQFLLQLRHPRVELPRQIRHDHQKQQRNDVIPRRKSLRLRVASRQPIKRFRERSAYKSVSIKRLEGDQLCK